MRSIASLLVCSALGCAAGAGGAAVSRTPLSPKDIVARSSPAIVRIEAGDGTGTGFIIDRSGLVATNLHVVAGNEVVKVKLHDGNVYPVMGVVNVDPGRDLALLRIAPPGPLPTLQLGDSNNMSAGDQVVTIGNPLGVFTYSVSGGLISQVREVCSRSQVERHRKSQARYDELTGKVRKLQQCIKARGGLEGVACEDLALSPAEQQELSDLQCTQELTLLQISVPISQGSSGGPLFNQFGEVVGVTTAIITGGQNINLAIPSNYVKPMVASPAQISMQEFAVKTRELADRDGRDDGVRIKRDVPEHEHAIIFQGCQPDQIAGMVLAIEQAIDVGAPLYNKGEIEACFRIYEGTAVKFERDSQCPGIRKAFGDGLGRAKGLDSYKEKAWAMRDTFDGLINVARKWARANPRSLSSPQPPSPQQPSP
jgi:S1-C subfamily serine protease